MRVLFIGYAVSEDAANVLSGASVAGNRMQLGFLRVLAEPTGDFAVDSLTVLPLAAFPRDRTLWVREGDVDLGGSNVSRRLSFVNLPVLKQIMQVVSGIRVGGRLMRAHKYDRILAFNMYPQVGIPAWWLGRWFRVPVVSLLADLPIDQDPDRQVASKAMMVVHNELTRRLIRTCEGVIVLNQCAAQRYAPQAACLLLDGAIDASLDPPDLEMGVHGPKNIVFTGALVQYNGILPLIDAMRLVRTQDLVLDVYGDGQLATSVRDAASSEPNINYHGKVGSSAMASIQKGAFLLINPRVVADPISEVTFPSKVLEYMLSGTPILSTRLNGLRGEYEDKMYFIEGESAQSIAFAIDDLASRPPSELRDMGAKARRFVLHERSWAARAAAIRDFLAHGV